MAELSALGLVFGSITGAGPARAEDSQEGDLYVQSNPPGATILLDGQPTGATTPALLRAASSGPHDLRLEQGCGLAVARVEVRPRVVTRTELTLQPGSGRVEIDSTPAGAEVVLDGIVRGQAPLALAVACGTHEIVLQAAGSRPWHESFALATDEVLVRSVELIAIARGTLVVVPEPLDSEVWLDGVQVGQGALTLDEVEAGAHELELRANGLTALRRRIDVPEADVLRVEASLVRPADVEPSLAAPVAPARTAEERREIGRRVLAGAVALAGAGLAAHGAVIWGQTAPLYQDYLEMEDHRRADVYYDEHVAPTRIVIGVDLAAAGLLMASATGLWVRAPRDWFHPGRRAP
jgi:hypothetical protein